MIRVLLDGTEISNQAEVDLSFVKKLDRELDEGFLVISHTDIKDQFPMFSIIDILENQTLLFSGRISNDMVELKSFGSEFYNHNVSLIEHTKILEKFLVTGKTFTQPVGNVGVPDYTLFDVVDTLRTTSFLERDGLENVFAPFTIPQELEDELDSIIAPEFLFKDVTLRQALDEVGNVINSICRLNRDNEIVFDKFNDLLDQIDGVSERYNKQQNIDFYSTNLSSDIINPISQIKDNLRESEYYPSKNLWTTLRSDFGRFDFESSFIPTPQPIYEISEVKTVVDLSIYEADLVNDDIVLTNEILSNQNYELDITDNVVEKSEYDTLFEKPLRSGFTNEKTKRDVIFYEYGKKNIQIGKTYGLFNILTVYREMLKNAALKDVKNLTGEPDLVHEGADSVSFNNSGGFLNSGGFFDQNEDGSLFFALGSSPLRRYFVILKPRGGVDNAISFKRWKGLFRVKYIPVPPSIRYEVVRDDITEINFYSNQTVNQKLRIVDLESFANNMKGRINQLGESQLMLSHKVKNISESWKIGDFTSEKFVITKKEVIAQLDHYVINYELNKNFNKISQFVGIDQEIRQWEIGESGRSLDRDLNYNEYIEVYADDEGEFSRGENTTTLEDSGLFFSTFDSEAEIKPITLGTFSSNELLYEDGTPITINVPFYRMSGGDSFGIYFDFATNASASDELREGDEDVVANLLDEAVRFLKLADGIPRYFNVPVKYTDEIGRLDTFNLSLYDEDDFGDFDFDEEAESGNSLPIINKLLNKNPVIRGSFAVKKDNRERIKMTMQYHLISKDINEVVIGNKLSTHNFLSIESPNELELRTFTNRTFKKRDKDSPLIDFEDKYTSNFLTINETNSFIEITKDLSQVDSWALTDSDGYPFIMVNGNKKRLVFEFNNKRDGIIYSGEIDQDKYLPPNFVSRSRTASSITMTLKNTNEDTVIVSSFLSFLINDGIQVETVAPNENTTFTFTGLEPNKTYTFFLRSSNTNPSAGQSGNNGLKNSDSRPFSITTDSLSLSAPVVTIDSLSDNPFGTLEGGRDTSVLFSITNNNSIPLRPFYETEVRSGYLYGIENFAFDLDEDGNVRTLNRLLLQDFIIEPNETKIMSANLTFSRVFSEDVGFKFETTQFENNFSGDLSSPITVDISRLDKPVFVETLGVTPVITTTSIEVRFNNPNNIPVVIEVERYSERGFLAETKTANVSANGNVDVLFDGLLQSRTQTFRAKFLEGGGRLESFKLGDPLITPDDEIITITTFDDFGAAPQLTRQAATETSLNIRYLNQDSRPVVMLGGPSGTQIDQIGNLQSQGDSLIETYSGLRAGDKYTFEGRVRLQGETVFAPEPQTTVFETFTKPLEPTLTIVAISQTQFTARAFNSGNQYPVEILRNGNSLGTVEPGSSADVIVTGLNPGQNYTFTFISRLDGLDSTTRSFGFQTVGPLSDPVVTVESATTNSITPRIQNNNNRFVRAFGRFLPTNLSDLGNITSNSSNVGFTFSSDQLQANRGLTFFTKFVDTVDANFETNVITTTLHTAPLLPVISNFQFVTAGPDVVEISFDLTNNNNQFGPDINGTITVINDFSTQVIAGTNLTNITPNSTNNFSFNLSSGDLPSGVSAIIEVTFENPTSESATEFRGQT